MTHAQEFLAASAEVCLSLDHAAIERLTLAMVALREQGGRLFCLGAGGSAANATHAVNDFRKLCGIEAYSPTDNVAELTARVNDDGWDTHFEAWLRTSRAAAPDALFVLSVGGGDRARGISVGILRAVDHARAQGMPVWGIVGREDCDTKALGDEVVVVPIPQPAWRTPLAEAFQAVIWHALVSDPRLLWATPTW